MIIEKQFFTDENSDSVRQSLLSKSEKATAGNPTKGFSAKR